MTSEVSPVCELIILWVYLPISSTSMVLFLSYSLSVGCNDCLPDFTNRMLLKMMRWFVVDIQYLMSLYSSFKRKLLKRGQWHCALSLSWDWKQGITMCASFCVSKHVKEKRLLLSKVTVSLWNNSDCCHSFWVQSLWMEIFSKFMDILVIFFTLRWKINTTKNIIIIIYSLKWISYVQYTRLYYYW